jgi:hypothetical protein
MNRNISDRILNNETIVLSRKWTRFMLYALIASWVIMAAAMVPVFFTNPQPGPGAAPWVPYFFMLILGVVGFIQYRMFRNLAEVWIEGQKLHIKKVRGPYDIIPFANIDKVKKYRQKGGKRIVIEYTNTQGLSDKATFTTSGLFSEDPEDILLVAQNLWKEGLLDKDGTLDLMVPSPIERTREE